MAEASDRPALEAAVVRAQGGDRAALEAVVRAIRQDVHALALRFLWHPQDAEDAAQEILVRVVTRIASFRGESAFRTWVYRVACNALLTMRKQRIERQAMSAEEFREDLRHGLADDFESAPPAVEQALLLEEVKIGCTLAMLLCLDRNHRLAYILGEIMELDHREASQVLEISADAYRKRLSRAHTLITSLMTSSCGLIDAANACRCRKRVAPAIALGRVDREHLLFASSAEQARRFPQVLEEIRRLDAARRAAALYRSHPEPKPSDAFAIWLRRLIVKGEDPRH